MLLPHSGCALHVPANQACGMAASPNKPGRQLNALPTTPPLLTQGESTFMGETSRKYGTAARGLMGMLGSFPLRSVTFCGKCADEPHSRDEPDSGNEQQ